MGVLQLPQLPNEDEQLLVLLFEGQDVLFAEGGSRQGGQQGPQEREGLQAVANRGVRLQAALVAAESG